MRAILHSDLNSYYASVEMMLNPSLRGKAVAVCGSTENRHGIVLAKSELAKMAGVKTEMVNWEAKRCCPSVVDSHAGADLHSGLQSQLPSISMQTAVSNAELEGDGELCHGAFSASLYVAISHSGSNNSGG